MREGNTSESSGKRPAVLFVDDEDTIRTSYSLLLDEAGFKATTAATVPEALSLITRQKFDVLIADLNIGNPGDGFTVVSAMRRTQPDAATFILTGYPAFESALEAIRQQVDDYFVKPTDIEELVETIRASLVNKRRAGRIMTRRLADVIGTDRDAIVADWLSAVKKDPEITAVRISDAERQDHVPRLLEECVNRAKGLQVNPKEAEAAEMHGATRRRQGYAIPLVIKEASILQAVLGEHIQNHLLSISMSYLVPDMTLIFKAIQDELTISVREFLKEANVKRSKK